MFHPTVPPDDRPEHVHLFRKEHRVTCALTATELVSYSRGICPEPLKGWLDREWGSDYTIEKTYNYQRFLFTYLANVKGKGNQLSNDVLKAVATALNISTTAWSNINFNLDLLFLFNDAELSKWWKVRQAFDKVIKILRLSPIQELTYKSYEFDIKFLAFGDYVKLLASNGEYIIIPWLSLIAYQDSCIGICDALIYARVRDYLDNTEKFQLASRFINICVTSAKALGKVVYKALKSIHPCAVGKLLLSENSDYVNDLYDVVINEFPECPLKQYIKEIPETIEDSLVLLELSGLAKVFTYPIVCVDTSVENVIDKGYNWRGPPKMRYEAVDMYKKIFCREYLREHHTWPPVQIVGDISTELRESITNSTWGERKGNWHPDMFRHIRIGHCVKFEYFVDSTELLTDKAICAGLDAWPREYDMRYHRLLYQRGCRAGPQINKRAIIEHLQREEVNTVDLILEHRATIRAGKGMITMCIKEKELSQEKGRYFTKLTYPHKITQGCAEANQKRLYRYFPHQSMTMTGLTLQKFKLRNSNKPVMTISIDFEKWCLNQRHMLNEEIAKCDDEIMDCPGFFESAHLDAEASYCFFSDRANIPEQLPSGLPKCGPRCIYGLLSLGEGMFQKLWTKNCVCCILYWLYNLNRKLEVVASGDNVVIMVWPKTSDKPRDLQAQVFERLEEMADHTCLPIKLEETFTSNHYFEYGKDSYYDGQRISMGLKKASRIGTEMEESIPSMNARLSSIFSTGVSVSAEDSLPIPAYIVSCIEACMVIFEYSRTKINFQTLTMLLLVTRSLGGLKVSNYSSFCVRGIQDGASQNLHILMALYQNPQLSPEVHARIFSYPIIRKPLNLAALVRDPYNLPLSILPDAESEVRSLIQEGLPSIIKNRDIKPLFSVNATYEEANLISDLSAMEPKSLKLMASIFQYSNVAQKEKAIARFQTSTSVNKIISDQHNMQTLFETASVRDTRIIDRFSERDKRSIFQELLNNSCPTIALDKFRRQATGFDLINPSGPPPSHQFELVDWESVPLEQIPNTIKVVVSESFQRFMKERGKAPAYIGSDTKIKRAKTNLELYSTDPLDKVVLSLAELSTWVGNDRNLQSLFDVMMSEKTTTDPVLIKTLCRQIVGGTFEHRGHLMNIPTGAYCNYNPTIMSHIKIITETATNFARKHENYSIMFQLIKVAIGSRLVHMYYAGYSVPGNWGAVLSCKGCTQPVYEGEYILARQPLYRGLRLRVADELTFVSQNPNIPIGQAYEGAMAYLGMRLAKSVIDWEHIERVSETDLIDRHDIHHNTSVNISEIARSDLRTLLGYALLFISTHGEIWEELENMRYSQKVLSFSPMELFMNTIVIGGHSQNMLNLLGSPICYTLDSPEDRCRVFIYLVKEMGQDLIKRCRIILPDQDDATNLLVLKQIAKARGIDQDKLISVARGCVTLGAFLAPPEDICIKELRSNPFTIHKATKCRLTNIMGGVGRDDWSFTPINATTYGLTVYASQVWSLENELPFLPVWILDDKFGSIGVVLGHSNREVYIRDSSDKRYQRMRITNGPVSIYYDTCTGTYNRPYFIKTVGTDAYIRPITDPLLIVSTRDPRKLIGVDHLLKSDDHLLTREDNGGTILIGLPRRYENDVWYLTPPRRVNDVSPMYLGIPHPKQLYLSNHPLTPYHRLMKLMRVNNPTQKDVVNYVNNELMEWIARQEIYMRGTSEDFFDYIKGNVRKSKSQEDILLLYWIRHKLHGGSTNKIRWHFNEDGYLDVECECNSGNFRTYKPIDELLSVLLVAMYKGL